MASAASSSPVVGRPPAVLATGPAALGLLVDRAAGPVVRRRLGLRLLAVRGLLLAARGGGGRLLLRPPRPRRDSRLRRGHGCDHAAARLLQRRSERSRRRSRRRLRARRTNSSDSRARGSGAGAWKSSARVFDARPRAPFRCTEPCEGYAAPLCDVLAPCERSRGARWRSASPLHWCGTACGCGRRWCRRSHGRPPPRSRSLLPALRCATRGSTPSRCGRTSRTSTCRTTTRTPCSAG